MPPDVTLDDVLYWDPKPGALKYELQLQDPVGVPFFPSGLSADVYDNGTATSFALSTALVGAATGTIRAHARAVDASGPGPWGAWLDMNFAGIGPVELRLTPWAQMAVGGASPSVDL